MEGTTGCLLRHFSRALRSQNSALGLGMDLAIVARVRNTPVKLTTLIGELPLTLHLNPMEGLLRVAVFAGLVRRGCHRCLPWN